MTISSRRQIHERIAPLSLRTLAHGTISVPDPERHVHLQFRRFAGCPVCNLHLQTFSRAHEELVASGVLTVAFFHSPGELMRPYQGQLPFPTVPDPDRSYYRAFGVERSMLAVAHPQVMWSAMQGLFRAPSNPFAGGTDQTSLPADFLLRPDGTIAAVHYGAHADDHWSVERVIELASESRARA